MSRLEKIQGEDWRDFVDAPLAVLVLGKSDCDACRQWSEELEEYLDDEGRWPGVRFGKMVLDEFGLGDFKKSNRWLADIDTLPFTQIYERGERAKSFTGGGLGRLETRLRRLTGGEGGAAEQES
jgi:hypothetical protein